MAQFLGAHVLWAFAECGAGRPLAEKYQAERIGGRWTGFVDESNPDRIFNRSMALLASGPGASPPVDCARPFSRGRQYSPQEHTIAAPGRLDCPLLCAARRLAAAALPSIPARPLYMAM